MALAFLALAALQTNPQLSVPHIRMRTGRTIMTNTGPETAGLVSGVASNANGGWVTLVELFPSPTNELGYYGTYDDTIATRLVLRSSQHPGPLTNGYPWLLMALSEASIAHTTLGADFGAYYDGVEFMEYDSPGPAPGTRWLSPWRLTLSTSGDTLLVHGTYRETSGQFRAGIFRGVTLDPVLAYGMTLPGRSGTILDANAIALSTRSDHNGGAARLVDAAGSELAVVAVVNGEVLMNGGIPVEIGQPIAPGASTSWLRFHEVSGSSDGTWWVSGRDDGTNSSSNFVMHDGAVYARSQSTLDGYRLLGRCLRMIIAPDGRPVMLWNTRDAGGIEALTIFVGRRAVLREGDGLDDDGDGVIDPGNELLELPWGDLRYNMDLDEDGILRVACVLPPIQNLYHTGLVERAVGFGSTLCAAQPNSTGAPSTLRAEGTQRVAASRLELVGSGLPPQSVGYFVTSRTTTFVPGAGGGAGDLCIGGAVGRYSTSVLSPNAAGEVRQAVDLGALPQPMYFVAALPGESWHFQLWYRDTEPQGQPTSNFGEALTLAPR